MTGPLYKTTVVIWSDFDPSSLELEDLAREAMDGDAYCASMSRNLISDPISDPDWDGTEFFDNPATTANDSQLGPPTMGDHEDELRRATAYGGPVTDYLTTLVIEDAARFSPLDLAARLAYLNYRLRRAEDNGWDEKVVREAIRVIRNGLVDALDVHNPDHGPEPDGYRMGGGGTILPTSR